MFRPDETVCEAGYVDSMPVSLRKNPYTINKDCMDMDTSRQVSVPPPFLPTPRKWGVIYNTTRSRSSVGPLCWTRTTIPVNESSLHILTNSLIDASDIMSASCLDINIDPTFGRNFYKKFGSNGAVKSRLLSLVTFTHAHVSALFAYRWNVRSVIFLSMCMWMCSGSACSVVLWHR